MPHCVGVAEDKLVYQLYVDEGNGTLSKRLADISSVSPSSERLRGLMVELVRIWLPWFISGHISFKLTNFRSVIVVSGTVSQEADTGIAWGFVVLVM